MSSTESYDFSIMPSLGYRGYSVCRVCVCVCLCWRRYKYLWNRKCRMNNKLAAASKIERKLNLKLKMELDKASGPNEKTTGKLRTLCHHRLQGIVGHPHRELGWKVMGWLNGGAYSNASATAIVPMGAIGDDKPAWMAAIEGNHLGPVLTHNPPGPPWVMDAGRW